MGRESWYHRPYCVPIVAVVVVINVVALLGAARFRVISSELQLPGAAQPAAATSESSSESSLGSSLGQLSSVVIPPSTCAPEAPSQPSPDPVCVLISIGDDTGAVDPTAVPFSKLYRLFDAAKDEILRVHSGNSEPDSGSGGRLRSDRNLTNLNATEGTKSTSEKFRHEPVKVIVGVDHATVACRMARDALVNDFRDGFPDVEVELSCGEVGYASQALLSQGGRSRSSNFSLPITKAECGTIVVGNSAQYVPQISVPLCEIFSWKRFRGVDLDTVDASRLAPAIPKDKWRPTIVTAFSSNHFPVALLMLRSLARARREADFARLARFSIVIYGLEKFNARQHAILDCLMHEFKEKYKIDTEFRQFDFLAHPSWMRINQTNGYEKGGTGEYAWKSIIIHTVLVERGFVFWTDAGSRFDVDGLATSLDNTFKNGFASSYSYGQVPELVHLGQATYLRYQVRRGVQNCDASRIGFTLDKYESFARPWYDCCQTRQCIAPEGSNRENHRQDQSALTLLSDRSGNKCEGVPKSVMHHMDYKPEDFSSRTRAKTLARTLARTDPTSCYNDPLEVEVSA